MAVPCNVWSESTNIAAGAAALARRQRGRVEAVAMRARLQVEGMPHGPGRSSAPPPPSPPPELSPPRSSEVWPRSSELSSRVGWPAPWSQPHSTRRRTRCHHPASGHVLAALPNPPARSLRPTCRLVLLPIKNKPPTKARVITNNAGRKRCPLGHVMLSIPFDSCLRTQHTLVTAHTQLQLERDRHAKASSRIFVSESAEPRGRHRRIITARLALQELNPRVRPL